MNDFRECWKLQLCSSKIIPLWIFCWLNLLYILNYSCSNKMCAREVQCLKEYFGIFFNVMSMYSFCCNNSVIVIAWSCICQSLFSGVPCIKEGCPITTVLCIADWLILTFAVMGEYLQHKTEQNYSSRVKTMQPVTTLLITKDLTRCVKH